ncbi:MAG: hypothetical protein AAF707_02020 [Pseudomonadota bacterium]
MFSRIRSRLQSVDADVRESVGDLLLFFGYFLIAFYAGGNAYLKSYGDVFQIKLTSDPTSPEVVSVFISEVLSTSNYFYLILISISIVLIYAFSKFVFRFWFSFLLVTLSLISALVIFAWIGKDAGTFAAEQDKLSASDLPEIKVVFDPKFKEIGDSRDWRLLYSDSEFFYFVEQQGVKDAQPMIHAVRRDLVQYYEVSL